MGETEWNKEMLRRQERRAEINRPKKSIVFDLEKNKVREFRETDVVQKIENLPMSALRNSPATPSRLVKLKTRIEKQPAVVEEEAKATPAAGGVDSEQLETQSGQSLEDANQE